MPCLSIIMPVFNAEKYLSKAIESILNQTYTDFEFLIIDDCSTDNSLNILKTYKDKRIKIFQNNENLGSLKSRNLLFKEVKGKYISFQDADDYSELNRFKKLINFMNQNANIFLCGSNANFYNEKGIKSFTSTKHLNSILIKKHFEDSIPILFASSIVRVIVLKEIGFFREYFYDLGNYDYDWMYRISEKFACSNIKDVLYNVNRHTNSNSLIIYNTQKIIGNKIVQFLANERKMNNGVDSLMSNNLEKIETFSKQVLKPYESDKSLYLYDRIGGKLSEKMYKEAFKLSIKAIKINPTKVLNYRTLFYILKKWLTYKL